MIVSTNWLSEYVRVTAPVEQVVERLALSGLNHESTSTVGEDNGRFTPGIGPEVSAT